MTGPSRPNRHLHAASKVDVTGGSSAKWNLGFNNARVSNLQVEYNDITSDSVTLNQPIVSAEFEQGVLCHERQAERKILIQKRKISIRLLKY